MQAMIEKAGIIVLLLSADLCSSERHSALLEEAIQRHNRGATRVVPVLLRPCDYRSTSAGELHALPRNRVAVTSWPNRDEALVDVVSGVREVIAALRGGGAAAGKGATRPKVTPRYPDAKTQMLSEDIERARERMRNLEGAGLDAGPVAQEIRALRRALREGGQLRAGDTLGDGRYLLVDRVGRGGFSVVWKAEDRERGEAVAIKVLHGELAADPLRRERFFRGAHRMVELAGNAVVPILQPEGEDEGWLYFVMKFISGGDLRQAVLSKRVGAGDVAGIVLEVGWALARAHKKGLVHRDIKPANILLDDGGAAWLTDFDLVFAEDTTGGTRTGALGTFMYAAPEMMERPQDADPRVDVYGLGMTAIFGLSGGELKPSVLRDAAKVIGGLPCSDEIKSVLTRAVEWDKEARFADAAELCEALRSAMSPRAPPVKIHERLRLADLNTVMTARPLDASALAILSGLKGGTGEGDGQASRPRIKTSRKLGVPLEPLLYFAGADGLDTGVALRIGLDVLDVLSAAIARNPALVDGELSPARVHVVAGGVSGVTELGIFGLDTTTYEAARELQLAYMAPEAIQKRYLRDEAPVDHRSDLFSSAVILWELLARRRLFTGEMGALVSATSTATIPPLAQIAKARVAPAVDAVIMRALAWDPDRRYPTAGELLVALEGAAGHVLATHAEVDAAVAKLTGPARPGGRPRLVPRRASVSIVERPASSSAPPDGAAKPPAEDPARVLGELGVSAVRASGLITQQHPIGEPIPKAEQGSPVPGPGTIVGWFEILARVKTIQRASLWAARGVGDWSHQQLVALRTLDLHGKSFDQRRVFLDDVIIAARVRHPNVVEIHTCGEERGVLFVAMEWVEGVPITELLKQAGRSGGVPVVIALKTASQICSGLHAGHVVRDEAAQGDYAGVGQGATHFRLTPDSVYISTLGFAKLADSGLDRAIGLYGALQGDGYMSPEEVEGAPVDPRSHVFSLGTILYEMVAGLHPFRSVSVEETLKNITMVKPVFLGDIAPSTPPRLSWVVEKALEKRREDRYASILDMKRALDAVLSQGRFSATDEDIGAFVEQVAGDHLRIRRERLREVIRAKDGNVSE